MGTPTQSYVDPSIAGDSGAGTVGDPWGDLQYALDQVTRDAVNGDQINIKAGTDEVLTAALDLSTYGTPTKDAPLVMRGYASTANDGDFAAGTGIGGIDGDGSYSIFSGSEQYIVWKDLHLHSTGGNAILALNSYSLLDSCELDNTTGDGIVMATRTLGVYRSYLHNIGTRGVYNTDDGGAIELCYFANGTNDFTYAIYCGHYSVRVARNIISLDGSSVGIALSYSCAATHNSVLASNGTGTGILAQSGAYANRITNNLVEGFAGVGGVGIGYGANEECFLGGYNACYNNTDNISGNAIVNLGSDEDPLASSPFAKSGADTFANRFMYFAPVDVGSVQGGAYPSGCRLDKGAVQHADPAGGGGGGNWIIGG